MGLIWIAHITGRYLVIANMSINYSRSNLGKSGTLVRAFFLTHSLSLIGLTKTQIPAWTRAIQAHGGTATNQQNALIQLRLAAFTKAAPPIPSG